MNVFIKYKNGEKRRIKTIDIKNRMYYYFGYIITDRDINFDNI